MVLADPEDRWRRGTEDGFDGSLSGLAGDFLKNRTK